MTGPKDYSESTYEIQCQEFGWRTLSKPKWSDVEDEWNAAKARFRSRRLRLLQDGKVVRRK